MGKTTRLISIKSFENQFVLGTYWEIDIFSTLPKKTELHANRKQKQLLQTPLKVYWASFEKYYWQKE